MAHNIVIRSWMLKKPRQYKLMMSNGNLGNLVIVPGLFRTELVSIALDSARALNSCVLCAFANMFVATASARAFLKAVHPSQICPFVSIQRKTLCFMFDCPEISRSLLRRGMFPINLRIKRKFKLPEL